MCDDKCVGLYGTPGRQCLLYSSNTEYDDTKSHFILNKSTRRRSKTVTLEIPVSQCRSFSWGQGSCNNQALAPIFNTCSVPESHTGVSDETDDDVEVSNSVSYKAPI